MENAEHPKKPWYKRWWGVVIIIFTFPVTVPWLIWAKTNWSNAYKFLATAGVIVLFFAGTSDTNSSRTRTETPPVSDVSTEDDSSVSVYIPPSSVDETSRGAVTDDEITQVDYENLALVENFSFEVKTEDYSEANLQEIALKLREENCKRDCNIDLYDDAQAHELWKELEALQAQWFNEMMAQGKNYQYVEQKEALWNQENYIFMADHYIAWLIFDSDEIWLYPFRDSKYKELTQ